MISSTSRIKFQNVLGHVPFSHLVPTPTTSPAPACLQPPAFILPVLPCLLRSSLRQYDFTSATVALVPSVPGTKPKHKGPHLNKYGHMRVRALLENEPMLLEEGNHKISFQFSSFASLTNDPVSGLLSRHVCGPVLGNLLSSASVHVCHWPSPR